MYFFFIENKLKNKKIKRDQMMDKEVSPIQNIMLKDDQNLINRL